ncbi:MAG TPA: adenosine deaminase, partial [Methylibium sp.]
ELAVRAVLGQRVTVAAARTLARRLVERFGEHLASSSPWPELHLSFPSPAILAQADPQHIGELGILRSQTQAIQALAKLWQDEAAHGLTLLPEELIRRLVDIPGLGPWTAHYIAMRTLAWPDAFPPGDVAVLKAMGLSKGKAAEREAEARSQAWRPWRAYAVLRLWQSLENP